MTTASADPVELRRHAAGLAAEADLLDALGRRVATSTSVADVRTALVVQELVSLAGSLRTIAGAFEAADHQPGPGPVHSTDLAISRFLAHHRPDLVRGPLAEPLEVARGDDLAERLLAAEPRDRARLLRRAGRLTPAEACGLVDGLGAEGRAGRRVLRQLLSHLAGPSTPVLVALGEALLLGPSARDDISADDGPAATGAAPGAANPFEADLPLLRLLAHDVDACLALEAAHPHRSVALTVLLRHTGAAESPFAAAFVRNVGVGAVRRHRARRWVDVADRPDPLLRHLLDGLPAAAVAVDQVHPVSGAMARSIAAIAARHPAMIDAAGLDAPLGRFRHSDGGLDVGPTTLLAHLDQAIARDATALGVAVRTSVERQARAAADTLRAHPPGHLEPADLAGALRASSTALGALAVGADAAGQHERIGVLLTAQLLERSASGIARRATAALPVNPAVGAVVAPVIAGGIKRGAADLDRRGRPNDHREDAAVAAAGRPEAYLAALAMANDSRWAARLRGADHLRDLDVVGSGADRRRFAAWVDRQDPVVARALRALSGGRPAAPAPPG